MIRYGQPHVPHGGSDRDRRRRRRVLLGLVNMMRGGSANRSQQLMRLRVLLQFIAIVVIMFTVWLMAK